jgi:hypothetical protein
MLAYESPSHFHSLDVVNNDPDGNMELDSDAEGSQADMDIDVDAEGVPDYIHNDQNYTTLQPSRDSMVASSSKHVVCIVIFNLGDHKLNCVVCQPSDGDDSVSLHLT